MKKILSILLTISMVFALVGCGSKNNNTPAAQGGNANGTAEKKTYKIGVSIYEYTDNFMTTYRNNMEKYFKEINAKGGDQFEVVFADAHSDMSVQTQDIDNWITQGYDAIIVNLVQTSSGDVIAQKCKAAGIPTVFINREVEGMEYSKDQCYIGADARESGSYQGEIIYNLENHGDINGDGVVSYVMVMGDPENSDAKFRTEYSIKYLTDNGVKVQELEKQTANWMRDQAQPLVADWLTQIGDKIEVVFCNNDDMAYGALAAIEAAGRKVGKDIYLVGVDAGAEAIGYIKEGRMNGTVLNDGVGQSKAACDAAIAYCTGAENIYAGKVTYIPYVMVIPNNAANYQ